MDISVTLFIRTFAPKSTCTCILEDKPFKETAQQALSEISSFNAAIADTYTNADTSVQLLSGIFYYTSIFIQVHRKKSTQQCLVVIRKC